MSVQPDFSSNVPSSCANDSSVRQLVVPTQMIRPPAARVRFKSSAVSAEIMQNSECMWCSEISSALTGLLLSSLILYVCIQQLKLDELLSKLLSIVFVVIMQFIINKNITFKK